MELWKARHDDKIPLTFAVHGFFGGSMTMGVREHPHWNTELKKSPAHSSVIPEPKGIETREYLKVKIFRHGGVETSRRFYVDGGFRR